jgi:molecular chaperone Hsp33
VQDDDHDAAGLPEQPRAAASQVEVASDFVRERNVLLVRGDFDPLFEDLDLHLLQNEQVLGHDQRTLLREALAGVTLHLCSRPRDEMTAFTMNFRAPPLNVFVTGDSKRGNVCGRVFTKDIATAGGDRVFCQINRPHLPSRQSVCDVDGRDALSVIEQYYRKSEQLPVRCFRLGDGEFAMAVAHPDYDAPWFEGLETAAVRRLERDEELGPIERRRYHFGCGCDQTMILRMLRGASGGDVETIYGELEEVRIECPRCASVFRVHRDELQRFIDEGRRRAD